MVGVVLIFVNFEFSYTTCFHFWHLYIKDEKNGNKSPEKNNSKYLTGECGVEEKAELDSWLAEAEENRELMSRLSSGEFLKQAVGDTNRKVRLQTWNRIEDQTTGRRKRKLQLRWVRTVAAVFVLGMIGSSLWLMKNQRKETLPVEVTEQIHAGTSKAIIELANGQQIFLSRDTSLALENQGIQLINTKDTLNIIGTPSMHTGRTEYHVIRIPRGGEYIARLEDGSMVHCRNEIFRSSLYRTEGDGCCHGTSGDRNG